MALGLLSGILVTVLLWLGLASPPSPENPAPADAPLPAQTAAAPDSVPPAVPASIPEPAKRQASKPAKTLPEGFNAEKIAYFYAAKYGRNADYLLGIVHHTLAAAREYKISPYLLLAIISHESRFQSSARSNSGAEGLMQIVTHVHKKRFQRYGGIRMSFLPEVNIRIGASILRECLKLMKSERGGLGCYAGASSSDIPFVEKVLAEAAMIKKLAMPPGTGR